MNAGKTRAPAALMGSSAVGAVGTLLAWWAPLPWRIAPAVLGAVAVTVAFVSMCIVVARMKPERSSVSAVARLEQVYDDSLGLWLTNLLIKVVVIGMGFMVFLGLLVLNLTRLAPPPRTF